MLDEEGLDELFEILKCRKIEIEKDAKFCPICGAQQEEIVEEPAKEVEVIEKNEEE